MSDGVTALCSEVSGIDISVLDNPCKSTYTAGIEKLMIAVLDGSNADV